MAEVFHERLKSPIPTRELERRSQALVEAMKSADFDCILAPNSSQYLTGTNRWLTDTTAEVSYPQSSFIDRNGDIGYIACSGPPLDLYPPTHLIRIGKPWNTAPYFSVLIIPGIGKVNCSVIGSNRKAPKKSVSPAWT